jgi:hypothetical protein
MQQRENLAALQNAYGNQALLRMGRSPSINSTQGGMLQRKCACGNASGATGTCTECQKKQELPLQTKLRIGEAGDQYEQEADQIAEKVMGLPTHSSVSKALPYIQRFAGQGIEQINMAAPAIVDRVLSSHGSPMEPSLQQDMEQRFGHDFSQVRVHNDTEAERSAAAINANAYTVKHNIVFGKGQYAPRTYEGRHLIAHELTHTIQQNAARNLGANTKREQISTVGSRLVQRDGEFNVPTLDDLYNNALQASRQTGNWQDAAEKLNGFNKVDIQSRLAQLTQNEVGYIHLGALENPRVGPDSNVAQMTKLGAPLASIPPPQETQAPPKVTQVPATATSENRSISNMTGWDKLIKAFNRAKINATFREKILSLFTPKALVIAILSFAAVFVASQFTPVGWAADIGIALTGIFIGSALFSAIQHLIRFADARNATTDAELDQAGQEFADAVAEIEIDAIILLLTHGVGGGSAGGVALEESSTTRVVLAAASDGRVIPVIAETVPSTISAAAGAQLGVKGAAAGTVVFSTGSNTTPQIRVEDVTTGPHGPERPIEDVVARALKDKKAQGRWITREAGEKAVADANLDVNNMKPGEGYSIPIRDGAGEVVRPYNEYPDRGIPRSQRVERESANRAVVVRKPDGIHSFPIGPDHAAYNTPAPTLSSKNP